MSAQPKALFLADVIESDPTSAAHHDEAATELRRLYADAEESEALRERLSELLRNTAIALRGSEPELTRWSWHDLPELATALKAQRDALLKALNAMLTHMGMDEDEWNKPTFDQARAAIKAVEEQK